jgi:peptidoglycan-N-acetylglucosamine deacetylase
VKRVLKRVILITLLISVFTFVSINGSFAQNTSIETDYTKPYNGSVDKNDNKQNTVKTAYLTFDDGPSANNTPKILDILKKYKIKATFFVNGYGKKELYKRIADDGHVIGNHTYSHDYKYIYSSVGNFKKDVEKLSRYLETVAGKRPEILRFPGGSNNTVSHKYGGTKIMKSLCSIVRKDMGYQYFDWNVSSEDASTYRAKKDFIVNSVLKNAKYTNRAIILMHDAAPKTTTVEALPEIIDGLVKINFKFDVLTKDTPSVQFKV